jgi:lysophospholipid acyltransferase (LPLAT)-like uncharacterized protein
MEAFTKQLVNRFGGLAAATLVSRWMETLDYRAAYYQPAADPAHPQFQGPMIYCFWHEYIPFLFYCRSFCHIAMLVSAHRDAELLSQAAGYLGFETVRGSTQRSGGTALRDLYRKGQYLNLAITPDGPRGPRRRLAPGAIFLSSKMQIPLVMIGLGYDRPWRMRTWDRFAVPPLYGQARAVIGPAIQIPPALERAGVEHYRSEMETMLNRFTTLAEDWAASGERMIGEVAAGRARARRRHHQAENASVLQRATSPRCNATNAFKDAA